MADTKDRIVSRKKLEQALEKDEGVLFAYLYGSSLHDPIPFGSDIDVAVYLKPSDMKEYVRKEEELTSLLIARLNTERIDLRILNTLPLTVKYNILKEGVLLFSRDNTLRSLKKEKISSTF